MAINLPNSPSNGQTVTLADKTLVYNSTSGTWNIQTADSSGGSLSISDTAPSSPSDGDMWFDSSTLTLYAYYDDGDSQQWIDLAGQATTLQATSSDTAPVNPSTGALWFDTANLNLFVYYSDGSSNQWVQMNSEAPAIPEDLSDLTDTTNLLFDGQYSSLTGAPTSSTAGALGTLTKTFVQNEEAEITLSETISPVPNVSVFKEVPQGGLTSKGNWDVNANATNYEFFDEKPLNYNTITLTPSATGDGTFASSNPTVTNYVHSELTTNNSGLSNSGSPLHTLVTNAGTNDNQGTLDMYGVWMSPAGDKILAIQVFTNDIYRNRLHGFNVANPFSTTDADITYQTTGNGYYDIADGTTNNHRNGTFGIDPTGTHLYTFRNNTLYQYVATTGWEASTFSFTNNTFVPSGNGIPPTYDWQCPPTIPSNNGDYLLFCSANDGYVARYTMTTAWDCSTCSSKQELDASTLLSNAGYTSSYFRSAQYNSDGTLLLLGNNDQFFKLSLSTPYDITTASFVEASSSGLTLGYYGLWITSGANEGKYVVGQTGNTSGGIVIQPTFESLAFNAADVGKKVVGNSGSAIITSTAGAYTSVTAFADTSAISSWQLFGAEGKSDGSGIVFTQAGAPGGIPTSTLSNQSGPHTIHTGFFNQGFWWSNDGQYYYQLSQGTSNIIKVKCTTPWDLSTQTDEQTVSTTGTSHGITVSEDGLNIYYGGYDARIRRKPLSTAHDLSTAGSETSILCTDLNVAASYPWDFDISSDGTKLFFLSHIGGSHDGIGTLNLSTPYAIHTGVTLGTVLTNFDGGGNSMTFFSFNSDGSRLFVSDNTTSIYYWNLSSAYTLPSSATSDGSISFSGSNGQRSMVFDQYLFYTSFHDDRGGALGVEHEKQNRWTLSTSIDASSTTPAYNQYSPALTNSSNGQINSSAWVDLDSMVADETKNDGDVFYAVSTDDRTSWGVIKNGDGVRKIARNNSSTWQYNNDAGTSVNTSYDIANAVSDSVSYTPSNPTFSSVLAYTFNSDGTKLYSAVQGAPWQHELSTAFDISTASSIGYNYSADIQESNCRFITFNPAGTKMYLGGIVNNTIYQYSLSSAFDFAGVSVSRDTNKTFTITNNSPGTASVSLNGMIFNNDGTKMYITNSDRIEQYSLSTAYDISTASYDSINVVVATGDLPTDTKFNSDGTKLFIIGSVTDSVHQYSLSTAYDLSTISYDSISFSVSGTISNPRSLNFNNDGSKMYISHQSGGAIYQYTTSGTQIVYDTSETWVDGTNNNEHATLQEALGAQSFNRMDKAQLQAVTDPNHYVLGDTLDLMIAPYAASGTSPISDGVTIGYQADALIKQAINGTDYEAEFPATNKVKIKSLAAQNLKIRII